MGNQALNIICIQCRGGSGVCPDNLVTKDGSRCEDDVRSDSVTGGIQGSNQQCVRFSRPITTGEMFG
jgi:hypothetical protein